MKQLDPKSALLGLVAGVLLMFTLGAQSLAPASQVGRFKMSTMANHAFVIDTSNGRFGAAITTLPAVAAPMRNS